MLELLDKVYNDEGRDVVQSALIEAQYISFFSHNKLPNNIISYLGKYPESYVDLLTMIYKSDDSINKPISREQKQKSSNAYKILELFRRIPGCFIGNISEECFNEWISKVKGYALELGYKTAFELGVGKLLSYSPDGSDEVFPHEIVRNCLEKNRSETMAGEFITEKMNQRGAYYGSGGVGEKEIACLYYDNASKIRVQYPYSASLLERLGNNYMSESMNEQRRELMEFR